MSRAISSLSLSSQEKAHILSVFPHGLVALDLETTGLSALVDRIIEIAAVKITPDGDEEVYHQLVNPMVELTPENSAIHGLSNSDLEESPTLKRPLRSLWDFIGRSPIVAHNALFDVAFLVKGSHDFMIPLPQTRAYDSCRYARGLTKVAPGEKIPENYRLSTLAAFYNIPLHHHVALEDTFACMKIMAALIERTPPEKIADLKDRAFTISLTQFTRDAAFIMPAKFEPLRPLIRLQAPIDIQYTGGTQGGEWRPVRPIALLPMPKGPVLYAECLVERTNKSFVLKRIQAFRIRPEPPPEQTQGADSVELDLIEGE
jgi:DNA polymerase-3 subunit epsilon